MTLTAPKSDRKFSGLVGGSNKYRDENDRALDNTEDWYTIIQIDNYTTYNVG
jgi:hypothetical protein